MRLRRRRLPSGMTLIEVMLALAILITGLVAVFALLGAAIKSQKRAVAETEASMVASSVLADLRAEMMHGHIPRSDAKNAFDPSPNFPEYGVNRRIIQLDKPRGAARDNGSNREYFARIEVRWMEKGDNKSIVVQSILFDNRGIERPQRGN